MPSEEGGSPQTAKMIAVLSRELSRAISGGVRASASPVGTSSKGEAMPSLSSRRFPRPRKPSGPRPLRGGPNPSDHRPRPDEHGDPSLSRLKRKENIINATSQLKCPVCPKTTIRRRDLYLHFYQALSGWDSTWSSTNPHVTWAVEQGIEVYEGGFIKDAKEDKDKLKSILYRWLDDV